MLRKTGVIQRFRTPWRELLHPLPPKHRRMQWLKRDLVEINEAELRKPYYTLRSMDQEVSVSKLDTTTGKAEKTKIKLSHAKLTELRQYITFPDEVGPQPATSKIPEKLHGLKPRYPESWDTVAPMSPSRKGVAQ